jgi:hypothetical protein
VGALLALTLAACGGGSPAAPTSPTVPPAPTAISASGVATSVFTANWASVSVATSYRLDVSTSNAFTTFVTGYQDRDVGNVTSWQMTGLTPNAPYFYRVRAVNAVGQSGNSATIPVTTLLAETFSGNLGSTGQVTSTFLITNDGHQVIATLTSLSGATAIGLVVGTFSGGACNANVTIDGATAGTILVGPVLPVGTGCVRVYTPGNVPASVTFTVTVEHW